MSNSLPSCSSVRAARPPGPARDELGSAQGVNSPAFRAFRRGVALLVLKEDGCRVLVDDSAEEADGGRVYASELRSQPSSLDLLSAVRSSTALPAAAARTSVDLVQRLG